jgi:hypothetical protein
MNESQSTSAAEIDLYHFFKPLFSGLKKLGNGVLFIFRKIVHNKISFVLIVLLITLAGYSLRYILAPAYETQGIFVSNILPAKYCTLMLQNLNKLRGEKNISLLSQQLNINNEAAGDILSINLSSMRDTFQIDERDSALSLFRITLILKSMQHLDTIQHSLVNYLENNEYSVKRKEAKRKALEALRHTLDYKLQSLDSLKKIVNSSIIPRSEGKGIILGEPVDPVRIYQAEMTYYRELLKIDQALATMDNIEIIQPFLKLNQSNYPHYNRFLLNFFLASLLVAVLVVLLFGRNPK